MKHVLTYDYEIQIQDAMEPMKLVEELEKLIKALKSFEHHKSHEAQIDNGGSRIIVRVIES